MKNTHVALQNSMTCFYEPDEVSEKTSLFISVAAFLSQATRLSWILSEIDLQENRAGLQSFQLLPGQFSGFAGDGSVLVKHTLNLPAQRSNAPAF